MCMCVCVCVCVCACVRVCVCVCVCPRTLLRMRVVTGLPRSVMKMAESTCAVFVITL